MNRRPAWPLLSLTVALAACGGGGPSTGTVGTAPTPAPSPTPAPTPTPTPTPTPAPASVEREIDPRTADAAIVANVSPHIAINPDPAVTATNKLFVFLPGTGGVPRNQRQFLRTGAPRGYHVIGLTYPNDEAINTLCTAADGDACTADARREVITGVDTSAKVSVDARNSITGRLTSLLTYLAATYPAEGWGRYLSAGRPNWALIGVGGHSQGSGHAAYLAKLESLDRVVMFSGPADVAANQATPAPWLASPNVTATARLYGFTHTGDELVPFALATAAWSRLGMDAFGAVVSVDGTTSPYGNSHQLSTGAAPNPASPSPTSRHGATVVDISTPLAADGTPLFRPVWIYLAFP